MKTKCKTHSGAKKRLNVLPGGKVKRQQCGLRHLSHHMSSKRKRHLGMPAYINDANMKQVCRLMLL